MFKRQFSKVKGGKIKMISHLNKSLKGRGTPAVKKLDVEEVNEIDSKYLKEGRGMGYKKSIKPLQFKM